MTSDPSTPDIGTAATTIALVETPLFSTIGRRLYDLGYTEPRLAEFWGGAISDAIMRNNAAPAIDFCLRLLAAAGRSGADARDANLAALALLFRFHRTVPIGRAREALGPEPFEAALANGLLEHLDEHGSDALSAPFAITPYDLPVGVPRGFLPGDENLYLVSDHGTLTEPDVLGGDFVLGLGGAGRTLVSITPRERVGTAVDIGTGCGIQALLLARHSTRVIATDVSARALRLAALSADLSGVTGIDFRTGSLLEPLLGDHHLGEEGESVDLLVSNPPFVITPRTSGGTKPAAAAPIFEYRDGGMTGDRLVRSLFAAIPRILAPKGRAVCLGNWEITRTGRGGPETWVHDPDTSVLVVEREALDPISYAETWIRDGGIPRAGDQWNRASADWAADFSSRGVEEIVFGYVLMSRGETVETRAEVVDRFTSAVRITGPVAANPHGLAQYLTTVTELRSWLASTTAEELAETRFTRSPDLVEHRHFVPGATDPTTITLEQGIGFGQVFDLDTALAGFVSVADGTLTLRQTAQALAQLLDVNPIALEDQLIEQVRRLVAVGAMLPA